MPPRLAPEGKRERGSSSLLPQAEFFQNGIHHRDTEKNEAGNWYNEAMSHDAEILARVIEPEVSGLEVALARYLLSLDFRAADVDRMNVLAQKASEGTLTESECSELESYRHVGHLVALMQSKARTSLKYPRG